MFQLDSARRHALIRLLDRLIDQEAARVLVQPNASEPGFWFGGGNLVQDEQGVIWLCGRYRNYGDSRTGLAAGTRGLEVAVFRSDDRGASFHKVRSWAKSDLTSPYGKIVSYEGTALHRSADGGWELFISSEKEQGYPSPLEEFQKPGTGVWSIDMLAGPSPNALAGPDLTPVLINEDQPGYLHVKDPVVFDWSDGASALIFCSHPFSWSSSNSGLAARGPGETGFTVRAWELVNRGPAWDVAATRITARLPIPPIGLFQDQPPAAVYFYDGAECLRPHEESAAAVRRPRGYSCEEIGGALFGLDGEFPALQRLSDLRPFFVSPWGTGCSRYVDVLQTEEGWLATWQQGQTDGSQPLVGHFLDRAEIERILQGD